MFFDLERGIEDVPHQPVNGDNPVSVRLDRKMNIIQFATACQGLIR